MVCYTTTILKFENQGEKTGWSYIEVPTEIAVQLRPDTKASFRVKGKLDQFDIKAVSLLPMGSGSYIIPFNAEFRKGTKKRHGDLVHVSLEVDISIQELSSDLMSCFEHDPDALAFFNKLPKSHQHYYSKWIESAKTAETKAKRISQSLLACSMKMKYNEMMRWLKEIKQDQQIW